MQLWVFWCIIYVTVGWHTTCKPCKGSACVTPLPLHLLQDRALEVRRGDVLAFPGCLVGAGSPVALLPSPHTATFTGRKGEGRRPYRECKDSRDRQAE